MIILYNTIYEYAKNIDISDYTYQFITPYQPEIIVKPFRLIDDPYFIVDYDDIIMANNTNYIYITWDQPLHDDWCEIIESYLPIDDLNTVFYIKYIKHTDEYKSDGYIYKTPSEITI